MHFAEFDESPRVRSVSPQNKAAKEFGQNIYGTLYWEKGVLKVMASPDRVPNYQFK